MGVNQKGVGAFQGVGQPFFVNFHKPMLSRKLNMSHLVYATKWLRIEVWHGIKFSKRLWIFLGENILIFYFQFILLFIEYVLLMVLKYEKNIFHVERVQEKFQSRGMEP